MPSWIESRVKHVHDVAESLKFETTFLCSDSAGPPAWGAKFYWQIGNWTYGLPLHDGSILGKPAISGDSSRAPTESGLCWSTCSYVVAILDPSFGVLCFEAFPGTTIAGLRLPTRGAGGKTRGLAWHGKVEYHENLRGPSPRNNKAWLRTIYPIGSMYGIFTYVYINILSVCHCHCPAASSCSSRHK